MSKDTNYIEKKATEFRNMHGLGANSPLDLRALLLKLKVSVLYRPLSENFSGMAVKMQDLNFILINSSQTRARQNFSICHELYHLFIQENFFAEATLLSNKKNKDEKLADLFASTLLIPTNGLIALIPNDELASGGKLSLDTVIKAEQFFQVSRNAILIKLKSLGLINEIEQVDYQKNVIQSALRRGYPIDLYESCHSKSFFSDYGDLANKLLEDDKISESHYYSLMMDIGIDILDEEGKIKES